MSTRTTARGLRKAAQLSIMAFLIQLPTYSYAESYLSELEAEANSTDVQADEQTKLDWSYRDQDLSEEFPADLSHEQFEQYLKTNQLALSLFYEKLSRWNKKKVYQTYQQSHSVGLVRNEIKTRMTK